MAKDTTGKKTKKVKDKTTDKKDGKKDGKKSSSSLNPERQKVVTDGYRDGWGGIWKSTP